MSPAQPPSLSWLFPSQWRYAAVAAGLEGDAVGGVEQHLLELTRQVATPHQARRGGQGAFSEAGARTMPAESAAGSGWAGSGRAPMRAGPLGGLNPS
jgi:hypothetical protein